MTAHEKIIKYLRGRKLGATVPEIVQATGLNANTVRKEVGAFDWCGRSGYWTMARRCRDTGAMRKAYGVQS